MLIAFIYYMVFYFLCSKSPISFPAASFFLIPFLCLTELVVIVLFLNFSLQDNFEAVYCHLFFLSATLIPDFVTSISINARNFFFLCRLSHFWCNFIYSLFFFSASFASRFASRFACKSAKYSLCAFSTDVIKLIEIGTFSTPPLAGCRLKATSVSSWSNLV